MAYRSINPKNGKLLKTYDLITNIKLNEALERSYNCFKHMRGQGNDGVEERLEKLKNMTAIMEDRKQKYAELMTIEMGKTIKEGISEVDKCIT
jgi:succinate-semialdehyde dehydrogenase/glutarate-semialdehyde dehydrogenase